MMRAQSQPRAFSLLELLVVVTILVLVLGFALPAFSSILTGVERSVAQNQMRTGIAAGRDAAIANVLGDGAAVFMFEPGERLSIVPCREITKIRDLDAGGQIVTRSVFVPVADSEPAQLPKGWSIRGYAPPGRIHTGSNRNGWYEGPLWNDVNGGGAWLFPESGFYDRTQGNVGRNRQSFMIRFRSGTGEVVTENTDLCLVLDLSPESDFRANAPWNDPRLDRVEDFELAVRRYAVNINDAIQSFNEFQLLGDQASDTILVGPVIALGLYEEAKLAAGVGLRGLNRVTKSIYANEPNTRLPAVTPVFDTALRTAFGNGQSITALINQWMVGLSQDPLGNPVESDVRLFVVQVNTAELEELNP